MLDWRSPASSGRGLARLRSTRYLVVFVVLAVATAAAAAASAKTSSSQSPAREAAKPTHGGTLVFARALEPTSFTPWIGVANGDIFADMQIYDGLVEAKPGTFQPQPGLADSWKISSNQRVYTFHLRPHVRFSNGKPLTAADVKYSLDNAVSPKIDANYAGLFDTVKKVSILDKSHIRVVLKRPTPAFLYNLTISGALIINKAQAKKLGLTKYGFHPIGTGPFMVASFSAGSPTIKLKRNPHYWRKGLPYLNGITYKYIPDDNSRVLAVESGSAQIGENVPYSQVARVNSTAGAKVLSRKAFANDWISINGYKPPLNKVAVRQALVYATPLKAIAKVVFHDLAPVAATANMPTKYLNKSLKPYPYNTAKAAQLLKKAGVSQLHITLMIVSGDSVAQQVATILQGSWAKAGITLTIQQKDSNTANSLWGSENYELYNSPPNAQTSDVPVDDEFDQYMVSDQRDHFTFVGWNDPKAKSLVNAAMRETNEKKRQRDFYAYQVELWKQQPVIGLVFPPNLFAVRSNVHGFDATANGWPILARTWLSH